MPRITMVSNDPVVNDLVERMRREKQFRKLLVLMIEEVKAHGYTDSYHRLFRRVTKAFEKVNGRTY